MGDAFAISLPYPFHLSPPKLARFLLLFHEQSSKKEILSFIPTEMSSAGNRYAEISLPERPFGNFTCG